MLYFLQLNSGEGGCETNSEQIDFLCNDVSNAQSVLRSFTDVFQSAALHVWLRARNCLHDHASSNVTLVIKPHQHATTTLHVCKTFSSLTSFSIPFFTNVWQLRPFAGPWKTPTVSS